MRRFDVPERPSHFNYGEERDRISRPSASRHGQQLQRATLVGLLLLVILLCVVTYLTLENNRDAAREDAERALSGRMSHLADEWTPSLRQAQTELRHLAQVHALARSRFATEAEASMARLAALPVGAVSVLDKYGLVDLYTAAGHRTDTEPPSEISAQATPALVRDTPHELLLLHRPTSGATGTVFRLHLSKPLLRQRLARQAWPLSMDLALLDESGRMLLNWSESSQPALLEELTGWAPQGREGIFNGPGGETPVMVRPWARLGDWPLFLMATATTESLMVSLGAQARSDHGLMVRLGALAGLCGAALIALLYLMRGHQREIAAARSLRRRLFDAAELPMLILDGASSRWVDINAAALLALEVGSRNMGIGASLEEHMPDVQPDGRHSKALYLLHMKRALLSGHAVFEAQLLRASGALWWAEIRMYRFRSGNAVHVQASLFDITVRKRIEEALRESQHRLTQAQDIAQLGHWSRTYGGGALFVSDLVYRILEVHELAGDEARIEAIRERFPAYWNEVAGHLKQTTPEKDTIDCVHELSFPDGRVKIVRNRGRVEFRDGRRQRVLGTLQDVTRLHMAEERLKRMNLDLEREVGKRTVELTAIHQDMESFSYTVSHDLRAPLRSIRGLASTLEEITSVPLHSGCGECRGYIDRIQSNAIHMSGMIEGLLTLSQMSRRPLQMEPCDLSAMAWEIIESLSDACAQREINWRVEPGLKIQTDRHLLQVLMQNLLSNACKFTGHRKVADISLHRVPGLEGFCAFAVEDNGVGFKAESAPAMFRPFARLEGSQGFEGHGIGLATVQRILKRLQGTVQAEGEPGKGARFVISLPCGERAVSPDPETTALLARTQQPMAPTGSGKRAP